MLCKKEKLAIEKATEKYVELCTVDMNKAADMLKEKSGIERAQMHAILREKIETRNKYSKLYVFMAFAISVLTLLNNIALKFFEKNLLGSEMILKRILDVSVMVVSIYAVLLVGEFIFPEKRSKYIRALSYLKLLEKNKFYIKEMEQETSIRIENKIKTEEKSANDNRRNNNSRYAEAQDIKCEERTGNISICDKNESCEKHVTVDDITLLQK